MANTLTSLIPTVIKSLDKISREQIGFIHAVNRDSSAEMVALDQSITIPVAPVASTADNTPGVTAPDTGDQTIGNTTMTMSRSKHVAIRWNGEEVKGLQGAGAYMGLVEKRFEQAFRALGNAIEADLAGQHIYASRAYGTAGTTPFGTAGDFTDFSNVARILKDNGASPAYNLVVGNKSEANLKGKQSSLFKVNGAGTAGLLRDGMIDRLMGFGLHYSGQVLTNTAGTGASYLINEASGYAVGDTSLTLDTGTGTILAGDVITVGNFKYVVKTALAANVVVIQAPGLREAVANNATVTVNAAAERNVAIGDGAIYLATRAPAMPEGGDASNGDVEYVTDANTGLVYEIAHYRQFRQVVTHVAIAWGYKTVKPEHVALLLG